MQSSLHEYKKNRKLSSQINFRLHTVFSYLNNYQLWPQYGFSWFDLHTSWYVIRNSKINFELHKVSHRTNHSYKSFIKIIWISNSEYISNRDTTRIEQMGLLPSRKTDRGQRTLSLQGKDL